MAQPSWVKILAINFIGNVGYADAVEEELSLTHLWVKHDNSCSTLFDHVRSVKAFVFFKVLCTMILVHKGMSSCYMSVDCVRLLILLGLAVIY